MDQDESKQIGAVPLQDPQKPWLLEVGCFLEPFCSLETRRPEDDDDRLRVKRQEEFGNQSVTVQHLARSAGQLQLEEIYLRMDGVFGASKSLGYEKKTKFTHECVEESGQRSRARCYFWASFIGWLPRDFLEGAEPEQLWQDIKFGDRNVNSMQTDRNQILNQGEILALAARYIGEGTVWDHSEPS